MPEFYRDRNRIRHPRRGAVAIVVALVSVALLSAAGMATDIGRLLIFKNELQNYADSAALAAVMRLDGTMAGIASAKTEAENSPNDWNFDTATVGTVTVEFATSLNGTYEASPTFATGYRYVRVNVEAHAPIYLSQILPGVGSTRRVRAMAAAGLVRQSTIADGAFPFSPDAHDPNDPNFGFLLGKKYTLRYDKAVGNLTGVQPSPSTYLLTLNDQKLIGCPADMERAPAFRPGHTVGGVNAAERGYVDLSDRQPTNAGGGANLIVDGVLGRTSYNLPIYIGYTLTMEPGNKATIENAMVDRVEQDTDGAPGTLQTPTYFTTEQTSSTSPTEEDMNNLYRSAYATGFPRPPNGNGRRIVTVPVNNPANNAVVGFAAFYLPNDPCGASPAYGGRTYNPCCGEYIGSVTLNGGGAPGPGAGTYRPVLLQ